MGALTKETDLNSLAAGTMVMTLPDWLNIALDSKKTRNELKRLVTSQYQTPQVRTLDMKIAEYDYINWGDVGLYMGMQRIRTQIQGHRHRRRARKTGVTSRSVVAPVFLFSQKKMIISGDNVRPLVDVPNWVIEYIKTL